ncbi:MAG: TldD/PmbA family protein [Thaumarchaeota archaeon]|nr:TldD/PmbA family protein [Nitrososphaerota archaeon]
MTTDREVRVVKGEVEEVKTNIYSGVGIRVLIDGAWGFSSTNNHTSKELLNTLNDAASLARVSSTGKTRKAKLSEARLAEGRFKPNVNDPMSNHSIEEQIRLVREVEKQTRSLSPIKSASCSLRTLLDHKIILSSDGANAETYDSKPEFRVSAIASQGGETVSASETVGVTGGWKDLFAKKTPEEMSKRAVEIASKLLSAKQPRGERATVILDPGMVGLLCHEAIGHTVEADFVQSGSVVKDKIGQQVASGLVTLVDSGSSEIKQGAGGTILVDDQGVLAQRTAVIEEGVLRSYLHDRESAAEFGVESTGNARAFEYSDEPLIRMRNTYIEPGDYGLKEILEDVDHGYLLKGARNGQADANAEFMFGAQEAYLIEKGEVKELLRGVTLSGQGFEVLKSVDALGKEFDYDIGSGYCGKWQLAKVDGGGPYLRCKAIVGGVRG